MNIKSLATLAAAIVATSSWAAAPADTKCGAGTCGKKENVAPKNSGTKDAGCSKKDAGTTKEASCSKKEASCSKKDAACAKK